VELVGLNITIVGAGDRQLEELLRGPSVRLKSLAIADLLALAQPAAPQPDVVVLDLRNAQAVPPTLTALKRQHPATGVVIVATRMDPVLMLEAMRAGVNEWIADPITGSELTGAVERVANARATAKQGQVYAFIGAQGGVGTTTIAVNVAAAVARAVDDERTLLMDFHLSYGDAAVFLGTEPKFSVADALENTHRLDEAFFESLVAQSKATGVHLLASTERSVGQVDTRRIATLLAFAASNYRYVFLDVPRSEAGVLDSLEIATTIFIVANQELATVRNAARMAATLRHRYGKDRVRVIVNRYDKQSEIAREDVERVIGSPVRLTVPSDYRAAVHALNTGRPIVLDKDNRLGPAFRALAYELAGIPGGAGEKDKPGGLFGFMRR
jgi:pilus assembly protein CpaE